MAHPERPRSRGAGRQVQAVLFRLFEGSAPLAGSARHTLLGCDLVELGRGERGWERSVEAGGPSVLRVRVPDGSLSRVHARLRPAGGRWLLETPGGPVRVNGAVSGHRWLDDGDLLEVGNSFWLFRAALALPVHAPRDAVALPTDGVAPGLATLLPTLSEAYERLGRIAQAPLPVLLHGATGTGKEIVARAYHRLSGRSGPLVAVNCGAIPAALVEANLFGHRRGAFTGATEDREGLVASAHRGTLFLDEVAELPLPAQAALLRVLQEREVLPLGATRPLPVDVRIVAATHRDLAERVHAGLFREDLLARLEGHLLELPPLCERREDLGLMVGALLPKLASTGRAAVFTAEAARALLAHRWPRNVRELEQALAVALALADGPVELEHLPSSLREGAGVGEVEAHEDVEELRREELLGLLHRHAGNVSRVAAALSTSRMQVHRLCKRYGFAPEAFRRGSAG